MQKELTAQELRAALDCLIDFTYKGPVCIIEARSRSKAGEKQFEVTYGYKKYKKQVIKDIVDKGTREEVIRRLAEKGMRKQSR